MKEKLKGIFLDDPIAEELAMTLGIIGGETEPDDMSKVW